MYYTRLSVKQAAKELGVSESLVYGLCAAGKIRHERYGLGRGIIRIPPEAITDYRTGCTVKAASQEQFVPPPRPSLKHLSLS